MIGTGLVLNCSVNRDVLGISPDDAKEWQKKTQAEFALWASKPQNCDALGLNNFDGLQQLAMLSWLMSGDVYALFKRQETNKLNPYSLRIHLIEADRIRTPAAFSGRTGFSGFYKGEVPEGYPGAGNKVYDGVEVDGDGRVVAYYIHNAYPYEGVSANDKYVRVEAIGSRNQMPNILPIMSSERPDQYRGVPYLAQVIEPLLQLRRYTESQLMAALVQSFFTAWIETEADTSKIPFASTGSGIPGDNPDEAEEEDDSDYELGPGTVLHLKKGEKVVFSNPSIPTTGFDVFVKTFCRLIGAALELPYDVLIKEFNSSYSASRGALLEAWEAFKMRRKWFIDKFCQPVYEMWLSEAVALGRIKAPGFFNDPLVHAAWCQANWIGPVQGQLDPKKEAEASVFLAKTGAKTMEQVTREQGGGDWEANVEQLKHENELLREAGGTTAPAGNRGGNNTNE